MSYIAGPGSLALLLAAGTAAGAVNAAAGGGSLFSFPALMATGMPPVVANVTNTVSTVPGYVGGCLGYRIELNGQKRTVLPLTAASVVGAVAGSALLLATPPTLFRDLSPWLVLAASALLAVQPMLALRAQRWDQPTPRRRALAVTTQAVAGMYGGYFAAGLGILMLAALGLHLRGDMHRLNAFKAVLSLAVGAVSAAWFTVFADVDWLAALLLSASGFVGGLAGAKLARLLNPDLLRVLIVAFGVVIGVTLLV